MSQKPAVLAPQHAPDEIDRTYGWGDTRSQAAMDRAAAVADKFIYRTDLPGETNWGPWGRTPLSTWQDDCRPVVAFIQTTTGFGCSTYPGHDPSIGRAADIRPDSRANHTKLANWLKDNIGHLGIQYIWRAPRSSTSPAPAKAFA